MGNADRVSDVQPLAPLIEAERSSITLLVQEMIAADRDELGQARDEIDQAHMCPSGAKEAEYARLAQGMIDELQRLLAALEDQYQARWARSFSAAESMAGGVGQWDTAADDAKAATERLSRMYADRDKWEGTAAASYWSRLPGQGSATAQLAASSDAQGSALATGSLYHHQLNAKVLSSFLDVRTELSGARGNRGGNGLYMRRTAQATVSLRGLITWLGEAETSGAAEAEYLNTRLQTHENRLDDWDQLASGSSQAQRPVGNRTDTTLGDTRVSVYDGQVTDEGLRISEVG